VDAEAAVALFNALSASSALRDDVVRCRELLLRCGGLGWHLLLRWASVLCRCGRATERLRVALYVLSDALCYLASLRLPLPPEAGETAVAVARGAVMSDAGLRGTLESLTGLWREARVLELLSPTQQGMLVECGDGDTTWGPLVRFQGAPFPTEAVARWTGWDVAPSSEVPSLPGSNATRTRALLERFSDDVGKWSHRVSRHSGRGMAPVGVTEESDEDEEEAALRLASDILRSRGDADSLATLRSIEHAKLEASRATGSARRGLGAHLGGRGREPPKFVAAASNG
jgi:hypothetical protein